MATAITMVRAQCAGADDAEDRRENFTIADLSREFDVTARTIRFYEDQGLILPTRQGLNRIYSRADRFRLGWILRGKRLGFSLAEIKELLDLYEVDRSRVSQLRAALKRAREHVVDMERKAHDLQAQIAELRELEAGAVQMLRERGADPEKDQSAENPGRSIMAVYKAPLRDMRFVLNEVLNVDTISALPRFKDVTPDLVDAVLEEAAKICEQVLFPLNRSGDEEGCLFENGVVRTPQGFKQAYDTFTEGGWTNLSTDPNYGGQGLPAMVGFVVQEMICSANLAFGMYPGLSAGAYEAIRHHANDALKQLYLPKLGTGEWSGTMCLTEPHCGTDLGMLRTRAEPQADGTYKITGTKIFISAGEHDLSQNIIHLVLARLPDAPGGTKGISLFIVPKFIPGADGKPGKRNGFACGAIEHKMGIKASSTCVMNFDGATGWLIGEANKGLNAMFVMMNAARLGVGMQGLGLAETSYQSAAAYAKDRLQGRSLSGPKAPDKPADPIIVHPDVRRMLLLQKSFAEGARALAYWVGTMIDVARHSDDAAQREQAEDLLALLTPVIKAYFTDSGFEAANWAVQVYGGHGYIRENGVEQLVRDARITQLYEGANGIQALDLVGRKLAMNGGRPMTKFLALLHGFVAENKDNSALAEFVQPLEKITGQLQGSVMWLMQNAMRNHEEAGGAASDFLRLFALGAMALMWARIAKAAHAGLDKGGDDDFYNAKLATGRFFVKRVLPQADGLVTAIQSGVEPMMAMKAEAF